MADRNAEVFDAVAEKLGGRTEMQKVLGVSKQVLYNWRARGIPEGRHYEVVMKSGGRVSIGDLRPESEEA